MGRSKDPAPEERGMPSGRNNSVARSNSVNPGARSWKGIPLRAITSMAAVPARVSTGTDAGAMEVEIGEDFPSISSLVGDLKDITETGADAISLSCRINAIAACRQAGTLHWA
mmetsp:Transcript_19793/g.43066  ORF Transcript_19793/g.43066 Transcript_19793/m.43066 type:complete len:113 (+) Transcript_19793:2728-3066(+)